MCFKKFFFIELEAKTTPYFLDKTWKFRPKWQDRVLDCGVRGNAQHGSPYFDGFLLSNNTYAY